MIKRKFYINGRKSCFNFFRFSLLLVFLIACLQLGGCVTFKINGVDSGNSNNSTQVTDAIKAAIEAADAPVAGRLTTPVKVSWDEMSDNYGHSEGDPNGPGNYKIYGIKENIDDIANELYDEIEDDNTFYFLDIQLPTTETVTITQAAVG